MEIFEYTENEFSKILLRNIRVLTRGKIKRNKPVAILLGGQSGAGKTTIHRIKQKEYQGNIIIIDGDSFRSQHPFYPQIQKLYGKKSVEYTKKFSGEMVEHLIKELSDKGYNLLIEGTLRTVEIPEKTAKHLSDKGYEVQLAIMATKPELSYISTQIRYEELFSVNPTQARATSKNYHDMIVSSLINNVKDLEKTLLFQKIQVYERTKNCIYDSKLDESDVSIILEKIIFGEWTIVEKEMLKRSRVKLEELLEKNSH